MNSNPDLVKGSVRAARSVASKALRTVKPVSMRYMGAKEAAREGMNGARYSAYMTREQYTTFNVEADRLAAEAGFDVTPLDCYQD